MVTLPVRLLAAFALLLSARGIAVAQLPEAPPPHPPFRELVKEYQRLGLPLPPPDAELVRIEFWRLGRENGDDLLHESYLIGFRLAPPRPGAEPRYLIGDGSLFSVTDWFDPRDVEPAKPTPEALRLVDLWSEQYLCFAIQCELRGWHDLAAAAYGHAAEQWYTERTPDHSLLVELRHMEWMKWAWKLDGCGSDRKESLQRLKRLADEEETLRTPQNRELIRRLEQTIEPRKSKAGSIEALIDDLTEYCVDRHDLSVTPNRGEAYWKLAELGFDAVPALIEHVNDERDTRANASGIMYSYRLQVRDLCRELLSDLSAREIEGGDWLLRTGRVDADKAREWFATAKKVGEEKWLLDHALPKDGGGPITNQFGRPERLLVRVIGAKYPARLPAIYRAILQKPPAGLLGDYVEEIVASKLPREQKIALLEEGVAHKDPLHRLWALEGLAALDADLFRKRLAEDLKKYPGDAPGATNLIQGTDDPGCWEAFAAAAKRAPYEARMGIIIDLGHLNPPDKPDPVRRERVRFLAQFLDDRTAEPNEMEWCNNVEVRDFAASQLGGLLRFGVEYRFPDGMVQHDSNRGPITRLVFREIVRRAAEQELARLKK